MKLDQSPAATESPSSRKPSRKPALLAAAALIATGALGLMLGNSVPFAVAETATHSRISPTIERSSKCKALQDSMRVSSRGFF